MWKEIADKESQQTLYGNRNNRQGTKIEKAERGKRKAISLSKSSFESYRRGMLDDEIQAEIERRVELKMAGKKRKPPERAGS